MALEIGTTLTGGETISDINTAFDTSSNDFQQIYYCRGRNITFENVTIDCNPNGNSFPSYGIQLAPGAEVSLINCNISNASSTALYSTSADVYAKNSTFNNCGITGLGTGTGGCYTVLVNCQANDNMIAGFSLWRGEAHLSNCSAANNYYHGMVVAWGSGYFDNCTTGNNGDDSLPTNYGYGIVYTYGGEVGRVKNCTSIGNLSGGFAVDIERPNDGTYFPVDISFDDCRILEHSNFGAYGGVGIWVNHVAAGLNVERCLIQSCHRIGISCVGGNSIFHRNIIDTSNVGIAFYEGEGDIIGGNIAERNSFISCNTDFVDQQTLWNKTEVSNWARQ
jgi:hypothetical protein